MRLGLFVDAAFRSGADGRVYAGEELLGFGTFAASVGAEFDRFVLIARCGPDEEATPYVLPDGVELACLPFYPSLRDLLALARAAPATVRGLWRAVGRVDIVWISASNPVGLVAMLLAKMRGRRIALLVRQDSMEYFRRRLPGRAWAPVLAPLWLVDRIYRAVARRAPTTAVGAEVGRLYGRGGANVLNFTVNLTTKAEIDSRPAPCELQCPTRLLTVGRAEPEKNPLLLADVLRLLNGVAGGHATATWVGDGRLRQALVEEAARQGVAESIHAPGFVPSGQALDCFYDDADIFVHIALTEGVPGVLGEAMGRGLPVVATDVGGIREATRGEAALLVPPDDPEAVAAAVRRVQDDSALRARLVSAGLEMARRTSIDAEAPRVAAFLKET